MDALVGTVGQGPAYVVRFLAALLVLASAAACSDRDGGKGLRGRAVAPELANLSIQLTPVVGGLSAPLALVAPRDGTGRLFVVEQDGVIKVVPRGTGAVLAKPFLKLGGDGGTPPPQGFSGGRGEQGLLGLAFHPQFAANRHFFIDYTDANGDIVVARYAVSSGDANSADPNSGSVVLRVQKDFANHNGGQIAFGPEGYLYIGIGDGGGSGNPCRRAQTLDPTTLDDEAACAAHERFRSSGGNPDSRALQGKLLRIDIDRRTPAGPNGLCAANPDGAAAYTIPADNPFAGDDAARGCDEVWAFGLRNPWRFSFDRADGALWIGDVGQERVEEIDLEPAHAGGRNYGWSDCEGRESYPNTLPPSACALPDSDATPLPVLSYTHARGDCSVTGGYRYRGPIAALVGRYVYGDYCTGRIWIAAPHGRRWSAALWSETQIRVTSFGEDADGELYVVDGATPGSSDGRVLRLEPSAKQKE